MPGIQEIFGTMVFSDAVMRERLPKEAYEAVLRTMKSGRRLQPDTAETVAAADYRNDNLSSNSLGRAVRERDNVAAL